MEMRAIHDMLAGHPFFAGLDDNEICYIAGCGANLHMPAGHELFTEGDRANTFYVVQEGLVAIELHVPGLVVDRVGPGGVVGWSWLFPPYQRQFDARAVEDLTAIALDGARMRTKCDEDTDLGYRLMQRFARLANERMQTARVQLLELVDTKKSRAGAG
jgi:CRP/FNR family transcriptional regulator, cyclic AMP receptor protein